MNYCPHCGAHQAQPIEQWPHQCLDCHTEHFSSPKPVVALLLHAWSHNNQLGFIAITRTKDPYKGLWAFPGGYIDHAEDWKHAAAREAHEELGVSLDPNHFVLRGSPVSTPTNYLVLFAQYTGDVLLLNDLHPNPKEVESFQVVTKQDQSMLSLGVPSHNALWKSLTFL